MPHKPEEQSSVPENPYECLMGRAGKTIPDLRRQSGLSEQDGFLDYQDQKFWVKVTYLTSLYKEESN